MYEFAWRSLQFHGHLGAYHALEIAFVFETLGNGTAPLLGADPLQLLADTTCTPPGLPSPPRETAVGRSTT
jgi:hypothetical protein